ncbi:hypothetical protein P3T43_000883 [Paraburkholderia sp. GAS41]|jgi:hypothetical protein|uniref:hypothetical protein n=1 Tax=Paraburkholderia sp. GAS41 TaxID=3035134 RepID=UPI003D1A103F
MHLRPTLHRFARLLAALTASFAVASTAQAADWCGGGVWVDAMLGSYHIDPDPGTHFNEFNPGLGAECWFNGQWGITAGGFRNSLRRPSYYGGGLWAPEFAHFGFVRIAAIAGIISGYNYGNWGLGRNHTVGPVAAPVVMFDYKRVGANLIFIPPIPSDNLPFTIGFQVKVKF